VPSTDLYALLGVNSSASADEIKRSYRRLARELHPDANPGDPSTEAKFKEVSQAYEILSDPERRENYDRFGTAGFEGGFAPGSVQDIFDMFFGSMGNQGAPRRRGPQSGPDAELVVDITLEDAAFGVTRDVDVTLPVRCETCSGRGSAAGTTPFACDECHGTGEVRRVRNSFLGQMMTTSACALCRGMGEIIATPCETCHGDGRENSQRTLNIEIPAGVENGSTMRLLDRGPAGPRGGPNGTLYVHLRVSQDERFEREGDDLHHFAHISFAQAALGATIEVPTIRATTSVDVAAGSQPGSVLEVRNEGVHHLRGRGRGDLVIHLVVDVPIELDDESERLLRELAAHRGDNVNEAHHGLLSRLRGAKK
jgi:molecular chaperone DnaJ